jgi:hypothetical protein
MLAPIALIHATERSRALARSARPGARTAPPARLRQRRRTPAAIVAAIMGTPGL